MSDTLTRFDYCATRFARSDPINKFSLLTKDLNGVPGQKTKEWKKMFALEINVYAVNTIV